LQTVWTLLFRGLSQELVSSQAVGFVRTSNDFVGREVVDANRS
jgi:hypothetical protein